MSSSAFFFASRSGRRRFWSRRGERVSQGSTLNPRSVLDAERGDDADYHLEVRDLHKGFGSRDLLCGINLVFTPGSITTVLGPSGTGKTVLLKHLMGILQPDEGQVLVRGQDIWTMSAKQRRELCSRTGVLFQDGGLMSSMTIYDNVALPLRMHTNKEEDEIRDIVLQLLLSVGLDEDMNKLPSQISGGMRKRVSFARAVVRNPSIVLFDEPDSGLDPVRTNLMNELILRIHERRPATYVVVTHHVATALKVSNYMALLWKGQIVIHGTPEAVVESDDAFVRQFLSGDIAGPLTMK